MTDIRRSASILMLIIALMALPRSAHAQNLGLAGITMSERVGYAYHLLTRTAPTFEEWIVEMPAYKDAQPHTRIRMLDTERKRLQRGYAHFLPSQDFIYIRFAVKIKGMDNPIFNPREDPEDFNLPPLNKAIEVTIPNAMKQGVYFPFPVGKTWIALIADGLRAKRIYPLTEEEYKTIELATGMNEHGETMAEAELILRPLTADNKTPMMVDGMPLWLMIADIASFSIVNKLHKSLWDRTAPWYAAEKREEFMTLYNHSSSSR